MRLQVAASRMANTAEQGEHNNVYSQANMKIEIWDEDENLWLSG